MIFSGVPVSASPPPPLFSSAPLSLEAYTSLMVNATAAVTPGQIPAHLLSIKLIMTNEVQHKPNVTLMRSIFSLHPCFCNIWKMSLSLSCVYESPLLNLHFLLPSLSPPLSVFVPPRLAM